MFLCFLIASPVLIHFGDVVFLPVCATLIFLVLVVFGPITGVTLAEFLPVYFTVFWAVLGKTYLAQKHLLETRSALSDWDANNA